MLEPGPARSSRRERKKARTRREIFRTALALFEQRGVAAVTVEEICREADVARGTFFAHFPTKADVLAQWGDDLARELEVALRDHRGTALAQLRLVAEQIADHGRRRPEILRELQRERLAGGPPREDDALQRVVVEVVRRGQQRRELRRNVSAEVAGEILLAACAAVFSRSLYGESAAAGDPGGSSEQRRNELLHALLHGLHEPKPRTAWRPEP